MGKIDNHEPSKGAMPVSNFCLRLRSLKYRALQAYARTLLWTSSIATGNDSVQSFCCSGQLVTNEQLYTYALFIQDVHCLGPAHGSPVQTDIVHILQEPAESLPTFSGTTHCSVIRPQVHTEGVSPKTHWVKTGRVCHSRPCCRWSIHELPEKPAPGKEAIEHIYGSSQLRSILVHPARPVQQRQ